MADELSPTVTGTYQHVVEALIILYQVGEDMLLPVFNQMLQI